MIIFKLGDFIGKTPHKPSGDKKGPQSFLCTRLVTENLFGFYLFYFFFTEQRYRCSPVYLSNDIVTYCISFLFTFHVHSSPIQLSKDPPCFLKSSPNLQINQPNKLDPPTYSLVITAKCPPTNTNQHSSSSNPLWYLQIGTSAPTLTLKYFKGFKNLNPYRDFERFVKNFIQSSQTFLSYL